ncbi:hypothetical protein NDN08_006352 [Rhodosorus marinus]|uniref:BHLH domain-containing protein n=1 Tax=Rhodosorus marinus TaxID=101924 RepID=A0AAV8UPH5_9RHOD|nr:hypothetical protein NDN08_006352 [Rhodosorus marinus]
MSESSGRNTGSEEGATSAKRAKKEVGVLEEEEGGGGGGEANASATSKKEHQRRHTQNSRAKLNSKFDELLALIQPLYNVDRRHTPHRSEVLDYAIHAYNDLTERKIFLETEIALSSEKSLNTYLKSFVESNMDITSVLEFYVSMICAKKQWRYGEVWRPNGSSGLLTLTGSAIHRTVMGEELERVRRFLAESRSLEIRPPEDLIGRVFVTQRTEWMNDLEDAEVFVRAQSAKNASLKSVFALPICDRNNNILAVTTFFSQEVREYDSTTVSLSSELGESVVHAFDEILASKQGQAST